jgi:large subunit ribosomal protein L21
MFAVIRTGGKQYRVTPDDVIRVEKLAGDAGSTLEFNDVLMIGGDGDPQVGSPLLDKAAVFAEIVEQTRNDKIIVFKKKRRQNYRRKAGHRQDITVLRITDISADGSKPTAAAKPKTSRAKTAKEEPEAAAVPAEASKE